MHFVLIKLKTLQEDVNLWSVERLDSRRMPWKNRVKHMYAFSCTHTERRIRQIVVILHGFQIGDWSGLRKFRGGRLERDCFLPPFPHPPDSLVNLIRKTAHYTGMHRVWLHPAQIRYRYNIHLDTSIYHTAMYGLYYIQVTWSGWCILYT